MNILKHAAVVLAALFLTLGIPTLMYVDVSALLFSESADAVTRASDQLPDQPSGEYFVLLSRSRHLDTEEQWSLFFSGEDAGVIMNDINCMVVDSDETAIQLAERFQLRLPENQMDIKRQSGILLASKAENNLFDVIIISKELADRYKLQTDDDEVAIITVKGE